MKIVPTPLHDGQLNHLVRLFSWWGLDFCREKKAPDPEHTLQIMMRSSPQYIRDSELVGTRGESRTPKDHRV